MTRNLNNKYVATFTTEKLNKKLYLLGTTNSKAKFTHRIENAMIFNDEKDIKHTIEFLCSAYITELKYENDNGDWTTLPFSAKYELPLTVNIVRVSIRELDTLDSIDRQLLNYLVDRGGY